jgi:hypothetical protein
MKKKKRKRLTDAEIRETVEKIRGRYAAFMERFGKPRTALSAFEDRYIQAMRARMDLSLFLYTEMKVVEDLIKKEEEKQEAERRKAAAPKGPVKRKPDFADRVIAQNRKRIEKYPSLGVHNEASQELQKLYGALGTVDREIWPPMERLMRRAYPSVMTSPRTALDSTLLHLCRQNSDGIPPRLARYRGLFDWFPRNYLEIEREEKKCILDAAFLLHRILDVLSEINSSDNLNDADRAEVEKLQEYVHTVVDDFRLRDLKPIKR